MPPLKENQSIYLDHNATTPLRSGAATVLSHAATALGNPSSLHRFGQGASKILEDSRDVLRRYLGARNDIANRTQVVFTSGGTEADAMLCGMAQRQAHKDPERRRIVFCAMEHPAVLAALEGLWQQGFEPIALPVQRDGRADLSVLAGIDPASVAVATLMLAHNESGVLQPVQALCEWAAGKTWVHCDAVQAVGKVDVAMTTLGVQSLALAAHKFGGPRGVGALLLPKGVDLPPLWQGGGQERGLRPGTQAKALVAAMAAALEESYEPAALQALRSQGERLREQLSAVPGLWFLTPDPATPRLPNTVSFGVSGHPGPMLQQRLGAMGVSVATGAACHGAGGHGDLATAIGLDPERAQELMRWSVGWSNTEEDIVEAVRRLRSIL